MYNLLVALIRLFVKIIFGLEVEGLEHIPEEGGAIVAANHTTWFDPIAVAVALPRPLHFMAKAELFKIPALGWVIKKLYAFPVKRGMADREAIREAQNRVTSGHLLGIFPEGTRNKGDGELLPIQGGTALIALKTGVPVIPVIIQNVKPLRFRKPVKVIIGQQVDLGGPKRANKQEVSQASSLISEEFSDLIRRNN